MNSGPNHPTPNPGGGRGRRRRRGRRGHGAPNPAAQAQSQGQGQQGQTHEGQHSAPQSQGQGGRPQHQKQQRHKPKHGKPFHKAGSQQQPGNGSGRPQRRPGGGQNRGRQNRTVNPKAPDASIFTAPMDHSYRMNSDNGNSAGNGSGRGYMDTEALPNGNGSKPIFAFVDDLFFLAKIQETARKLNVKVAFVKPEKETLETITSAETKPSLIIFDLNSVSAKPLTTIPKLKSKLKKGTNIIGFLSHLQGDLKLKAQEAGCDMVLPRSAFSQNLPQLLRRHAADDLVEDGPQPTM